MKRGAAVLVLLVGAIAVNLSPEEPLLVRQVSTFGVTPKTAFIDVLTGDTFSYRETREILEKSLATSENIVLLKRSRVFRIAAAGLLGVAGGVELASAFLDYDAIPTRTQNLLSASFFTSIVLAMTSGHVSQLQFQRAVTEHNLRYHYND